MSNTKHTPGPWAVKGYGTGIYPAEGNQPIICSMTTPSGFIQNAEANAKLIAAAPELLQALEECEEYFFGMADADYDETNPIPNKEMRMLTMIKDVIQKVKP